MYWVRLLVYSAGFELNTWGSSWGSILGQQVLNALYNHLKEHYDISSDEIPYVVGKPYRRSQLDRNQALR